MPPTINLAGQRFGRLAVLERLGVHVSASGRNRGMKWRCRCECGTELTVLTTGLRSGDTKSCGCLVTESAARARPLRSNFPGPIKHGHTSRRTHVNKSPTYRSWQAMHSRCRYPSQPGYPRYGGAGVEVCPRWSGAGGFANFLADMGPRPRGMTLDRKKNANGYEPANCRWATPTEQTRNRRRRSPAEIIDR